MQTAERGAQDFSVCNVRFDSLRIHALRVHADKIDALAGKMVPRDERQLVLSALSVLRLPHRTPRLVSRPCGDTACYIADAQRASPAICGESRQCLHISCQVFAKHHGHNAPHPSLRADWGRTWQTKVSLLTLSSPPLKKSARTCRSERLRLVTLPKLPRDIYHRWTQNNTSL